MPSICTIHCAHSHPDPHPDPYPDIDTPREERRPTVFISYARVDAEFANQLIADLNANGHVCWIDTTMIKGGEVRRL